MAQCTAITRSGERCKGIPPEGFDLCYVHDPSTAEERKRHSIRGGKKGGRGRPVAELQDIKNQLQEVVAAVRDGTLRTDRGSIMIQAFNAMIRCLDVQRNWREQDEVLERLDEMEAREKAERELSNERFSA